MLHLAGSRLLLTDFHNRKVNVVDMDTNSQVSKIGVPGNPWDICLLPGDRVAVSLASNGIQFLETREQIVLGYRLLVDGDCRSISYHSDRLIVSYFDGKVTVLDMNGHVIRGKRRESSRQTVFKMPLNLTVVCENSTAFIYVSDYRKNTITKLDMNLNIMKTFQDPALKHPQCITALGNELLICGSQSNIMILDLFTGHMTQLMGEKEGIRKPICVYYCLQQRKLLVTGQTDSAVKVYNIIE
ncbi:uncharacterized protein LOC128211494 [Mya arenaria]|uniref:uncharacterized protein LOC128211494 n=1 Tax=Mya arenaria TaxID=6604 RepID=UPI0022E48E05|nr:uncharacterized protein LOC128211494 [Mya arenaria]